MVDGVKDQLPLFPDFKPTNRIDFDELAKRYPRSEGRKKGIDKLKRDIDTYEDFKRFEKAMDNYIALCEITKKPKEYIKHFYTFVKCWTDYEHMDLTEETKSENATLMDMIKRGDL